MFKLLGLLYSIVINKLIPLRAFRKYMQYKYLVAVLAITLSTTGLVLAHVEAAEADTTNIAAVGGQVNKNASSSSANSNKDGNKEKNATSSTKTDDRDDNASTSKDKDCIDEDKDCNNDQGKLTSESHRSVVATFVHSLKDLADRDGGIGEQVREIARSQNDSATTTLNAMKKVEDRGGFRTFLFGTDYKNIGMIRSEIATTSNNIAKLKSILEKMGTTSDQADLSYQIKTLEAQQSKLEDFVTSREKTFSLFGWFNKRFAK